MKKVLFVCLGNICRSPTAHAVLEHLVQEQGLQDKVQVDSCGTGAWHIGHAPDERSTAAAAKRGYDLTPLRARRFTEQDFAEFDYILTMDTRNMADVMKIAPSDFSGKIQLFLDYAEGLNVIEVPDPYHGGKDGFELVLDLVEAGCKGLLAELQVHS